MMIKVTVRKFNFNKYIFKTFSFNVYWSCYSLYCISNETFFGSIIFNMLLCKHTTISNNVCSVYILNMQLLSKEFYYVNSNDCSSKLWPIWRITNDSYSMHINICSNLRINFEKVLLKFNLIPFFLKYSIFLTFQINLK